MQRTQNARTCTNAVERTVYRARKRLCGVQLCTRGETVCDIKSYNSGPVMSMPLVANMMIGRCSMILYAHPWPSTRGSHDELFNTLTVVGLKEVTLTNLLID